MIRRHREPHPHEKGASHGGDSPPILFTGAWTVDLSMKEDKLRKEHPIVLCQGVSAQSPCALIGGRAVVPKHEPLT